jgi:hypothetical protein
MRIGGDYALFEGFLAHGVPHFAKRMLVSNNGKAKYRIRECSVVLLGFEGFYSSNNSNGKTTQFLVKNRIPNSLRYSAVPCSKFDIHKVSAYAFSLLREGEGPENRLSLMQIGRRPPLLFKGR